MRKELCDALVARAQTSDRMVFITGDLGFMALEPLQAALGERFINAGVAEQNMVSVAAAMAAEGLDVWVYSIAPFCYARPFEQIRNDIAFHNLPVKLLGNGGGYGYGVMGPTHHAIEDYGVLLTLPNMSAYVPAFNTDLQEVISRCGMADHPSYIRLGYDESPAEYRAPVYAPWRQLCEGDGPVVVVTGALVSGYVKSFAALPLQRRPDLWVCSEMPVSQSHLPDVLLARLTDKRELIVIEEHVKRGGLGAELALLLAERGASPNRFKHYCAKAHHYERYGSQQYLRHRSMLDVESIVVNL